MKPNYDLLSKIPLFGGISKKDMEQLLDCLSAKIALYDKNQPLFLAGDRMTCVGVVLSGGVQIIDEDFWGNRNLLAEFGKGDLFAETFAFSKINQIPVTAVSVTRSEIMLLDYSRILAVCSSACPFHLRFVENMIAVLARKNILLNEKIQLLSKRSTREKLLSYLSGQARKNGSLRFSIPFNRQELADYLCVDRSAMSSELGKLKNEGMLRFDRNHFELRGSFEA